MRTYMNDNKETIYAIHFTEKELALMSNLVTHHIKTLEMLIDTKPQQLPPHKEWMYLLEDKLEL
jgi:hypothetical protein